MSELSERREQTLNRVNELRTKLTAAATLMAGKACVYATGSFGRCEASGHSDLDLFILGKREVGLDGKKERLLKQLDEVCVKADLIRVSRELRIPEFDGDGRYLAHHTVDELITTLGTSEDDAANTFTARLLLLLESRPLIGDAVYDELTDDVIGAYWEDYAEYSTSFIPAFLANDILRLWRTFCVNYEAGTQRVPEAKRAKRRLKNYKLKHSRMLTCYSALLYLLAIHRDRNTVSPKDAKAMIKLTPTERLEWLLKQPNLKEAHGSIMKLIDQYEEFLRKTNASEKELIARFADKNVRQAYRQTANLFGDAIFEALNKIGNGERFHRLLVV